MFRHQFGYLLLLFPCWTLYRYCLFLWYLDASHQYLVETLCIEYNVLLIHDLKFIILNLLIEFDASTKHILSFNLLLHINVFEGNSILYGFYGWREFNSICENAARSVWVGNQVLRNIFVPLGSNHAVKYPLGLVIFIGSVAWYGLSLNCVWNWRNWLGLIKVWSSYGIYKASCESCGCWNNFNIFHGLILVWKRRHIIWYLYVVQYSAVATQHCRIRVTVQFCSTMEWFACVIQFYGCWWNDPVGRTDWSDESNLAVVVLLLVYNTGLVG